MTIRRLLHITTQMASAKHEPICLSQTPDAENAIKTKRMNQINGHSNLFAAHVFDPNLKGLPRACGEKWR